VQRILFWLRAARVQFFTGSALPVIVCATMAWRDTGLFHWGWFWATLVGMLLIHAGANLANDFFDHVSGTDTTNVEFSSPFTGGSRFIQDLRVFPLDILWAALICLAAGSALGLVIVWYRGWWILALGLIGVATAFFYTAPPFRLAHHGLGEVCIFLDFGMLPALGAYYVQAHQFSWGAVAAGMPNAILITAILFINQFQDLRADESVGKRNWVVRMGRNRARWWFVAQILAAPFSAVVGVALGWLPPIALISLLACAPIPGMFRAVMRHYDDPAQLTPANAGTVVMHLLTGVLLTLGLVVGGRPA
jgi:1,4-dihydroxy-2-naphthoate octaprenyltransferase